MNSAERRQWAFTYSIDIVKVMMYRAVTFNFIKLENSLFSLNTGFKMPRGGKKVQMGTVAL